MNSWKVTLAALLVLAAPSASVAQGYYGFSLSESMTDPFVNTPAPPGAGVRFLNLWFLGGCQPGSPGISSAEFKVVTNNTDWVINAFTGMNGAADTGGATPDATGLNLKLAIPTGCQATVPVRLGQLIVTTSTNPGVLGFSLTDNITGFSGKAVGVDCNTSAEHEWPSHVRFVGYATTDATTPRQDHGADCSATPVERSSWGSVKALYP